jgi:hypothetical protein
MKKNGHNGLKALGAIGIWAISSSFVHANMTCDAGDAKKSEPSQGSHMHCEPIKAHKKLEMDLRADALFFIASQEGLEFATSSKTTSTTNANIGHAQVKKLDFKWDYGFRAALGFLLPERRWDSQIIYTWFHDRAKGKTDTSFSSLLPTFSSSSSNSAYGEQIVSLQNHKISRAKAKWNLYLDVIDWELGKNFIPMKWFSFRPFAGIKAAWIHQQYDIDYLGYRTLVSNITSTSLYLHLKNNYWGVGPECGFNSQFWLGYGLSIYGNAGVSLVYGKFFTSHDEKSVTGSTKTTITNVATQYSAGRAITDLQLGLRWDSNVCKNKKASKCLCPDKMDKMNFSLSAGWEQHMYFSQGQFFRFTDVSNGGNFTRSGGDLSLQGAMISARLDY